MRRTEVDMVTRASAGTATFLLILSVAGCGSSGEAAGTPPAIAGTRSATLSPAALASRVAMVDSDLVNGGTVKLIPGGDQMEGKTTLNNCGYAFTTEAHRVARRQVNILTPEGQRSGVSNEVAVYDSAKQAAKALTELRKSVTGCRKNVFHKSPVAGVPKLRYDGTVTTAPSLPVKDNAVATITLTPEGPERHLYLVQVYQRQGTVLSAVYLQSTTKLTGDDVAFMRKVAVATGKRLAAI